MSRKGASSIDLARRVEDLRMYRTNVRRYSTLDFKQRFQDQDKDMEGFSAQRRRNTVLSHPSSKTRGDKPSAGPAQKGCAQDPREIYGMDSDERYSDEEEGLFEVVPALAARYRRDDYEQYTGDDSRHHKRRSEYYDRTDNSSRQRSANHRRHREEIDMESDSGSDKVSQIRRSAGRHTERERHSSSDSEDSGPRRRQVPKGAWTRDFIPAKVAMTGKVADKSKHPKPAAEPVAVSTTDPATAYSPTEVLVKDRIHSDEDLLQRPHDIDEVALSPEREEAESTETMRAVTHANFTKPILMKPDGIGLPKTGLPPDAALHVGSSVLTFAESKSIGANEFQTVSSKAAPLLLSTQSNYESPSPASAMDPAASVGDSTLQMLKASLEEQARLRSLLEVRGIPPDQCIADAAAAKNLEKDAESRLNNTLQEMERVVQQLATAKAELDTEKRKSQDLEKRLSAMTKQLEDTVAMRDEFQQRSDFLASDLQSKEERLSQAQRAVLAAQTNKHASLSSNESPVDTFSHNDVVLLAKAGTTEPIKLRPNVHFYPATIPSPAKELGAVSPTSPLHEFDDETALYPPPAESPPSSPAVNIREGEPLIPPLFIDEDSNAPANKNMAKPPLSPKAKAVNSENCRNSKYKSPLDLYKKVGSNHRKDYVLLEINIADGKQRSLRIDTDTQPLELAYGFLESHELNPEYLIPLTEYITQTQEKLIEELDEEHRTSDKDSFMDNADHSLLVDQDQKSKDPSEASPSGRNRSDAGSRLSNIAKSEKIRQNGHIFERKMHSRENSHLISDEGFTAMGKKPDSTYNATQPENKQASRNSPGGFSFHTFEDDSQDVNGSGDDSSLAFYLSPSASPGSRRSDMRDSAASNSDSKPSAHSSAGGAADKDAVGAMETDLGALAELVEKGEIKNISDLLNLVQNASLQGKSKLSELADFKSREQNTVENSEISISVQKNAERLNGITASATKTRYAVAAAIDAPVSLSKPQRPLRHGTNASSLMRSSSDAAAQGTLTPHNADDVQIKHIEDYQRIRRHEKDRSDNEQSTTEEIAAGNSEFHVTSDPSPRPAFPTLTQRDSFLQRHPAKAQTEAMKPFLLRSNSSPDSDSLSSDSSSASEDAPFSNGQDIDIVSLCEEKEDGEMMEPEEAAVVRAYIDHIMNAKLPPATVASNRTHTRPQFSSGKDEVFTSDEGARTAAVKKSERHVSKNNMMKPGIRPLDPTNRSSTFVKPLRGPLSSRGEAAAQSRSVTSTDNPVALERRKQCQLNAPREDSHVNKSLPNTHERRDASMVELLSRSEGSQVRVSPSSRCVSPLKIDRTSDTPSKSEGSDIWSRSGNGTEKTERPIAFGDYGLKAVLPSLGLSDSLLHRNFREASPSTDSDNIEKHAVPRRPPPIVLQRNLAPQSCIGGSPAHITRRYTAEATASDAQHSKSPAVPQHGSYGQESTVRPWSSNEKKTHTHDLPKQSSNENGVAETDGQDVHRGNDHVESSPRTSASPSPNSVANKRRLNALLLHPELLPYMRAGAQKDGVLQKRHHSFSKGVVTSPIIKGLNPFKQEWQKRRYLLDFQSGVIFYFADNSSKQADNSRGTIYLTRESEVNLIYDDSSGPTDSPASTFQLGGVSRNSKRRGPVPLVRSRHDSDQIEADHCSETEEGTEVIMLRAESAMECTEWVAAIKAAILMISLGLTSDFIADNERGTTKSPHVTPPDGRNTSIDRSALKSNELDRLFSIETFGSKASSPTAYAAPLHPPASDFQGISSDGKSPEIFLSASTSSPSRTGNQTSERHGAEENRGRSSASPSLWNRVRLAVTSPRSEKRTDVTGLRKRGYPRTPSDSGSLPSDGIFFTPSPVQAEASVASPWSPMPVIAGAQDTRDNNALEIEQEMANLLNRKHTESTSPAPEKVSSSGANESQTLNVSTDDTYICDLEDAGRQFERATELARAGNTAEAVPLFLRALKEFERLQLPELPQIQDEIGFWLEAMESNTTSRKKGDAVDLLDEDSEFFSPERDDDTFAIRGDDVAVLPSPPPSVSSQKMFYDVL